MPFPQNFLDELLARSDIVDIVGSYVSLTPKGGSYWGCCPFQTKRLPPSMCCRTSSFTTASAARRAAAS